jgi:hypothetical protein
MAVPAMGAAVTNTYLTTGASSATNVREDLADIIRRIDPDETPLYSMLDDVEAKQIQTDWLVQELAVADDNAQPEGFEAAYGPADRPLRLNNVCQIFSRTISVSNSLRASDTVGADDEYDRQRLLKGLEVKRDIEYALTRPTAKKATDPRKLAGLPIWCTNGSVGATGVMPAGDGTIGTFAAGTARAMTLDMFADAMQQAYEDGGKPEACLLSPRLKRGFSALPGTTGTRLASDNVLQATRPDPVTIIGAVDVYQTDFGRLQMVPDRLMPNDIALLVDKGYAEVAPLPGRNIITEDYAKTGDAEKGGVVAELTLRVTAPKAHACIFGLLPPP